MKANKIVVRALVLLGFGGAVGLSSGCGASRAHRSRGAGDVPPADTVNVRDGDVPVRVMYGVPPARFDPGRDVEVVRPDMP